jgi:hypothetical protein
MFVGSFDDDFNGFQADVVNGLSTLKSKGATRLLIDLTDNGGQSLCSTRIFQLTHFLMHHLGGFVCLGQFLHQYLAGSGIGYP